ncbi:MULTISPECIES: hypothetical protein [Cytobacillus]|uniref:Uncharacterized protein n=1 Tax=Cytobacillus stercorigallinarum TaxID=2762240 RepID=A0ABR8QT26_9BACI|nr:hypothetical protein [Cytobacillus stercorigallinarum]MBD7938685.1 hypothetical protein [Cytobacillus stercorigallinarum]
MNEPLVYQRKEVRCPVSFYDALQLISNPTSEDFHRISFQQHTSVQRTTRIHDPLLKHTLFMCNEAVIFLCNQKKDKQELKI